ncbi:hypothetical protein JTE87_04394 [Bacillus amyloliquefaciens]|nr:hypothetical protein [Bacillus amyloliquefaciens]MCB5337390.1 hypothetical protein [Bacillus amyloliquefaciens]
MKMKRYALWSIYLGTNKPGDVRFHVFLIEEVKNVDGLFGIICVRDLVLVRCNGANTYKHVRG